MCTVAVRTLHCDGACTQQLESVSMRPKDKRASTHCVRHADESSLTESCQ
jgi:hypothetical protein